MNNLELYTDSIEQIRERAKLSQDDLFLAQYHFFEGSISAFYNSIDTFSITHFRKSELLYDRVGDKDMSVRNRYHIAEVYGENGLYEASLYIFNEVLKYYVDTKNQKMMAHTYSAIANVYEKQGDFEKEGIALGRAEELTQDSFLLGIVYYQIARRHLKIKDFQKTLEAATRALPIIKSTNYRTESGILLIMAEALINLGYIDKGIQKAEEAISIAVKREQLNPLSKAACFLAETYTQLEDYKSAALYSSECIQYTNQVFEKDKENQTNSIAVKLEQERANLLLLEAREKSKRNEEKLKSRNILTSGLSMAIVILAILFWFLRKNVLARVAATMELKEKQNELHKETLHRIELENKNQISLAILKGQEKERKRVARDLHDGVGGVLSSVRLNLDHLERTESLENSELLQNSLKGVKTAIEEIRSISKNSMPESLSKEGLVAALRDFISNIESAGKIQIDLQVYGNVKFSNDTRMMVFRILQELIHNSLKHSKADHIEVILIKKENSCKITVSDNGIGFMYSGLQNKSGLYNVEQRVAYLEGEMEVDTKENQGCYVFINIPAEPV